MVRSEILKGHVPKNFISTNFVGAFYTQRSPDYSRMRMGLYFRSFSSLRDAEAISRMDRPILTDGSIREIEVAQKQSIRMFTFSVIHLLAEIT